MTLDYTFLGLAGSLFGIFAKLINFFFEIVF